MVAITTARAVLAAHWDRKLPVRPDAIAQAMGVEVRREFGIEGGCSGVFEYRDGNPVITYDVSEMDVRQRFTIAHELGHYVLGHGKDQPIYRDTPAQFTLSSKDRREVDANKFAAQLLMPEEAVRHCILQRGETDVAKLASMFMVSPAAMRFRLKALGFL